MPVAIETLRRMTEDEFFAWQERQDNRCEFVDGFPVQMMSGASRRHDQIVVNILAELRSQLRGGPCRPFTADTAVRTAAGRLRRPDVGVVRALHDRAFVADRPRLVVEVLSPSTTSSTWSASSTSTRGSRA
jgi:Uma2 family endonuclease